eukprot:m51a1_g11823 hypothetical protein (151) ;mRNA; f:413386-414056
MWYEALHRGGPVAVAIVVNTLVMFHLMKTGGPSIPSPLIEPDPIAPDLYRSEIGVAKHAPSASSAVREQSHAGLHHAPQHIAESLAQVPAVNWAFVLGVAAVALSAVHLLLTWWLSRHTVASPRQRNLTVASPRQRSPAAASPRTPQEKQ